MKMTDQMERELFETEWSSSRSNMRLESADLPVATFLVGALLLMSIFMISVGR